jgi:hypothetical protein
MIRMGYVLNIGYDFRKNLLGDQCLLSTATNVAPVNRLGAFPDLASSLKSTCVPEYYATSILS